MKKVFILCSFLILLLVGCGSNGSSGGVFSPVNNLKTTDTVNLQSVTIDANYVSYYITPEKFEYDELLKKYDTMTITVSYSVSYSKTWTGPDMFYKGAPKYDIEIKNEDDLGTFNTGVDIPSNQRGSITFSSRLVDIKDNRIILSIGSTNIQNKIHFKNIVADYRVS